MANAAERLRGEVGGDPKRDNVTLGPRRDGDSWFDLVNSIDTIAVLDRFGVDHGQRGEKHYATCPGCGEEGALICKDGGIKCLHDRCSGAGPTGHPGFRSNVDTVATVKSCEPLDAVKLLAETFGIELPRREEQSEPMPEPPPDEPWNPTDDDAPDAPPNGEQGSASDETETRTAPPPPRWLSDWCDLVEQPPPRHWLLRHEPTRQPFLERGRVSCMAADGGVGKSYATLQLAVSITLQREWLDTFGCPAGPGYVALFMAEDDETECRHRLYRICNSMHLTPEARREVQKRILLSPLAGFDVALVTRDDHGRLYRSLYSEIVKQQLQELAPPDGWSMVAFDPLTRFGADAESSNADATALVQIWEHLALELPGSPHVFVTAHSSKLSNRSGGSADIRGVTALRNAFRSVVSMTKVVVDGCAGVLFEHTKANSTPEAPALWLVRMHDEPAGHGRYVPMGGVLRPASDDEIALLEAAHGGVSREARDQEKRDRAREAHQADRDAVLAALPVEPGHRTVQEILSTLRAAGTPKGKDTLQALLAGLVADGLVVDLSDPERDLSPAAKRSKPRQWARKEGAA